MGDKNNQDTNIEGAVQPSDVCSDNLTYQTEPLLGKMISADPKVSDKAYLAQYDDIFLNTKFFTCKNIQCSLM